MIMYVKNQNYFKISVNEIFLQFFYFLSIHILPTTKTISDKSVILPKTASYPGAMCCSMARVAFAWAAWINLIDFVFLPRVPSRVRLRRKQTKAPGYEAAGKMFTGGGSPPTPTPLATALPTLCNTYDESARSFQQYWNFFEPAYDQVSRWTSQNNQITLLHLYRRIIGCITVSLLKTDHRLWYKIRSTL